MAKTYGAKKVQVIYGGIALTGFMEDSFVDVERNSDSFTLMVGADGEGARAANADKSGKIKLLFLQTSIANDILSANLITDELSNTNSKSLMVKDGSGRTVINAPETWITKPPQVVFSKGIEGREWTLESDAVAMGVAGN